MRRVTSSLALLLSLLVAAPALAQQAPQPTAPPSDPSTAAPAPKDDKAGAKGDDDKAKEEKKPSVTGGYSWSDKKPAKGAAHHWRPKKKIDPNAPVATYPGFRMLPDGSSQLWVQVSRKVNVSAGTGGVPSFVLVGAEVTIRNNTRPLITEFFDTPLARARLKPDRAGAQLVLELREPVQPKFRVVDGPGGTMYLYVDLPKAQKNWTVSEEITPSSAPVRTGKVLPGSRTHRRRHRRSSGSGPTP